MISVDTNIVVRLLTGDDPEQHQKAVGLFGQKTVFLPDIVILETAWVLRHAYGFDRLAVVSAFRKLLGLSPMSALKLLICSVRLLTGLSRAWILRTHSTWPTVSLRMSCTHLTKLFPNSAGTSAIVL